MKTVLIKLNYNELVILHSALNDYKVRLEAKRKKEKSAVAKEEIYQLIFKADKLQDIIDAASDTL